MSKIVIFGNSGSGKSTLAKTLCARRQLAHLDLDTLAWLPTSPPQRQPLADSQKAIESFIRANNGWVIEGCYADLLEFALPHADEIIFMNLPVEACIDNARQRPWEPHKYPSQEAQDANLAMLTDWIAQYPLRSDVLSLAAHTRLYEGYRGKKRMIMRNERPE